jgi:hypothetical protein
MKRFSLLLVMTILIAGKPGAQKKKELVNDQIAKIEYSLTKKHVIFYIESAGSGVVKVDVNGNGRIDENLDRQYGRTSDWKLCTQFMLDESYTSYCGVAPSKASINVEKDAVIYTIPRSELSHSRKPDNIKVKFVISIEKNGSWFHYAYPSGKGLENCFTINL